MAEFNAKQARAKRPCPLWVDAFQRDTQHLEADEVGAYMLILMAMWTRESCDFPDDDARLARVSRVSLRLWRSRIGPQIRDLLTAEDGSVFSKRLREEATYVERQCKAQSDRKLGEKTRKRLKTNKPPLTTDNTMENPTDVSPDNPSQQPNNPTLEEKDKSSSSNSEVDLYLRYLEAHPNPVESAEGERAFAALLEAGEDPERIISSAAAYAEKAKGFSSPNFVQQSDNFLDPERGKWRQNAPSAPVSASEGDVLAFYANTVLRKMKTAPQAVSEDMARRLLAAELVTETDLEAAGVSR